MLKKNEPYSNVLNNSAEVLKLIYMVVAGLALADGLENIFVDDSKNFIFVPGLRFILFLIFLSIVVRFVHGAMRHFDQNYKEEQNRVKWKIKQPLIDFFALGVEAFLFFALAFSLTNSISFILYYLFLLLVDSIWLLTISSPNLRHLREKDTPRNWLIANSFFIPTIPFFIFSYWHIGPEFSPLVLYSLFGAAALAHVIYDYLNNWAFYFGRHSKNESKNEEHEKNSISKSPRREIGEVNTLFLAGAYGKGPYNDIESNIRLAEEYSIKLWNKGYGVFCPHLNTCHFEVKANVGEEKYKDFDLKMLTACDALFVLHNWVDSEGTKKEIELATNLGKPIIYSLEDLPDKSKL